MLDNARSRTSFANDMIIEHRTYTLFPGKTQEYFALYKSAGLSVQLEYLPNPIGYYVTELGPLNQVIHWGYEDLNDRARRRAQIKKDARWTAYVDRLLPLIQHQESKILIPAPFFAPTVATYVVADESGA
ncbi:NIPSNAP family protein [Trinickia mobilis]|uniref:NIPSNAP family protein n=1 Tax=Trinickia mobilis TaxID=2816356 RepID=UPI001F5C80F9|nr:NIPSNAP family protein [Trinickia mobilis]